MDKKEDKKQNYDDTDETDISLAYARPFEGSDL